MGVFNSSPDLQNQIKTEGETITVTFSPGEPEGSGTVRWNIPTPALGCDTETNGAYCGIVILLSKIALSPENIPQDGNLYVGDPTANDELHAGDKIGDALVVGAFYEGEKKSKGETLTTELIISDIQSKTPYYVAGYAVDCQGRYHSDGQRAYSSDFGNTVEPGTPGSQIVQLGASNDDGSQAGVLLTDGTGLVPGMPYEFQFVINEKFPDATGNKVITVSGNGEDFGTYQDLIDQINAAIHQVDNPQQSPVPPNQGRYYWNGTEMFQWDGNNNTPTNALMEPTDPANIVADSYWYNPISKALQRYDVAGSPAVGSWVPTTTITYHKDPTTISGGGDYWFDGTKAYSWCATTWCEEKVYPQTEDPTTKPTPNCGVYWYDETNSILNVWNSETESWSEVYAINWDVAPNAITDSTYWFDETNSQLKQYTTTGSPANVFNIVDAAITDIEPTTPSAGDVWYNNTTEELKVYSGSPLMWVDTPVLVWPDDPRDTNSCDLWWRTTDDALLKWDSVNSEWDAVHEFNMEATDPYAAPTITNGELWYTNGELRRWDGATWQVVTHMEYATQPNIPLAGDVWHDTENNKWYVRVGSPLGWVEINPVDSKDDPSIMLSGTMWFDTTNNLLYERSGTNWLSIPYSTDPFYPNFKELWFDTTNNLLMEWTRNADSTDPRDKSQGSWKESTPIGVAELNDDGHLRISTTGTGSDHMTMILLPESVPYKQPGFIASGTAGLDGLCNHYAPFEHVEVLDTDINPDNFLFEHLIPKGSVMQHTYGSDAISNVPTYDLIGVGDDGTPDERRVIMDWVRSQLGYPVVEVELTQKQIDEAVDMALQTIRQRTSIAYERCFTFLETQRGQQRYKMTDKRHGYDRIVTVTSAHRFTSAFLSTAHGSGVYGQIVLQHLYNMGTFDLLSYHLISEYVEQMEHLFATRLVFNWHEHSRILHFHQRFAHREVIMLDVMAEKTEQTIMKNRWALPWIKRFALMRGMEILSQIRGKYATLPGAGGGVSLNAADLISRATELREELNTEIEDYIADDPESVGINSTFILG